MALSISIMQITSFHYNDLNPSTSTPFPKTLFHGVGLKRLMLSSVCSRRSKTSTSINTRASLLEAPVLWAGRLCVFYALLKAGLAGSQANPLVSDLEIGHTDESPPDLGFSKWTHAILGKPEVLLNSLLQSWLTSCHSFILHAFVFLGKA